MAEPHVVSALKAKRAEIAGQIAELEKHLTRHRADLVHVDGVLRLYGEDRPGAIRPKAVRCRDGLFYPGEMPRLILDALRRSDEPMTSEDIARAIMPKKGLDPADTMALDRIAAKVSRALSRHKENGLVESQQAQGKSLAWRVG